MEAYQWVLAVGAAIFVIGFGYGLWKGNGDE